MIIKKFKGISFVMILQMKKNIILLLSLLLFSCAKQDREITLINQEADIDRYITSLGENITSVRNGGSVRVVNTDGIGEEAVVGDSVYFYYAGYIFSNGPGTLFDTNNKEVAEKNSFATTGEVKKGVVGSGFISGLNTGLIGVKQGEVCNIIFSAKYGYNNDIVYNVPKLSPLFFEIWIERIIKN